MEKLTVLCVPLNAVGHTNATLGLATALRKRGHKVVFAAERSWQKKFEKLGFNEEIYDEKPKEDKIEWLNGIAVKMADVMRKPPLDGYSILLAARETSFEEVKHINCQIQKIVNKLKPNVIIEDRAMIPMPALVTSAAPLVRLISHNPLHGLDDERLPPEFLGLPLHDQTDWKRCRENEAKSDLIRRIVDWLQATDNNIPKLNLYREYRSSNLNIIIYPKALADDYLKLCPLGDKWMRLDYCFRESDSAFELPSHLKEHHKKIIFMSFGSIGSSITELMERMVNLLSKSKHYFIVSKGKYGDQYDLPDNMWGEKFLPQLGVLPHVDLVITHGGNNTFVETLYFGKPMIVMPLFADQHDNAQRAVEMKIGFKFNPFLVEEKELNDAIDELLRDVDVAEKLKKISEEMHKSTTMDQVIDGIEYVAKNPKFPAITDQ